MNQALQRFIDHTIKEFGGHREYSPEKIMAKLEKEIAELSKWLKESPDWDTPLWREKYFSMRDKEANLAQIKSEN